MLRDPLRTHVRFLTLAVMLSLASLACGQGSADDQGQAGATPPIAVTPGAATTSLIPIANARVPAPGLLSGGQPTPAQIEAAAQAGFRTVINIRTAEEPGYEWERALVERLGMDYVQMPVGGADTLTRENVGAIDEALDAALARGPVLFHCASGNRIGATLALRAAWFEGASPEEALAYGQASGMTRLTEATRSLLGLE